MRGAAWERHRELVQAAPDLRSLQQRVLDCARDLGPATLGSGTSLDQWRDLGLIVVRRSLGRARGLLRWSDDRPVVVVNDRDFPRTQRFTIAHELGHLLLRDVDRHRVGLAAQLEEELCEEFASHLLIPREDLALAMRDFEDDPDDLLALIQRYDVSISALLATIGDRLAANDVVAFAVSQRGHRKRPNEIGLRVHRSLCGPYLMPEEVRLGSLGLTCLERRLEASEVGMEIADSDISVQLRLWRPGNPGRSGSATGPVSWRARRLPNGFALICLHTPALLHRWSTGRIYV